MEVAVNGSGGSERQRQQPTSEAVDRGRRRRKLTAAVVTGGGSGWRRQRQRPTAAVAASAVGENGGSSRWWQRQRRAASLGSTRLMPEWISISRAETSRGERKGVKTLEWHLKALLPFFQLSLYFWFPNLTIFRFFDGLTVFRHRGTKNTGYAQLSPCCGNIGEKGKDGYISREQVSLINMGDNGEGFWEAQREA